MAIFDFLTHRFRSEMTDSQESPPSRAETLNESRPVIRCSFCGKNQNQVRKIIAGPTVYICDECIDLCNDIIAEECERDGNLMSEQEISIEANAIKATSPCMCCSRMHGDLSSACPIKELQFCSMCLSELRELLEKNRGKERSFEELEELIPCTVCREAYKAAELYEPTEEPLYCEACLAELKKLAEERKRTR